MEDKEINATAATEATTCFEDESARTEYSKRFDNPQTGLHTAVLFSSPVHFDDGDGMAEIDNEFIDAVNADGEAVFENKRNKFRVRLAKSTAQKKLVEIEDGKYRISMTPTSSKVLGNNGRSARRRIGKVEAVCNRHRNAVGDKAVEFTRGAARMHISKHAPSDLCYCNALENCDLEYTVASDRLKENIIVNSKSDFYEFAFKLKLENLEPRVTESGAIELFDAETNEVKFTIPTPFMFDADGNKSDAVAYKLSGKPTEPTLTVTADPEWINADGRAFPVTIDPQIMCANNSVITLQGAEYPSLSFSAPTDNIITIGNNMYDGYYHEFVAKVTLNGLHLSEYFGSNLRITHAVLELTKTGDKRDEKPKHFYVREGGLDGKIVDAFLYNGTNNRIEIDITEQIQKLIDRKAITIDLYIAHKTMELPFNDYIFIATEKIDNTEYRPRIFVDFVSSRLNTDEMAYESLSAGRAGSGFVNLNTGKAIWQHPDFAVSSNGIKLDVAHVYDDFLSNKDADSLRLGSAYESNTVKFGCGYGFKLNLHEHLFSKARNHLMASKSFVYVDGNGNHHDFAEKYYYKDPIHDYPHYVSYDKCTEDEQGNLNYNGYPVKHEVSNESGMTLESYKDLLTVVLSGKKVKSTYNYIIRTDGTRELVNGNAIYDYVNGTYVKKPNVYTFREYEDGTTVSVGNRIDVAELEQCSEDIRNYQDAIDNLEFQIAYNQQYYNAIESENSVSKFIKTQTLDTIDKAKIQKRRYEAELGVLNNKFEELVDKKKREPIDFVVSADGSRVFGFDYFGRLVMISDDRENMVFIIYDYDDLLSCVVDKDGNKLLLCEYKDGLLTSMTNEKGVKISYKYDVWGRLSNIVYADGEQSTFAYDSFGALVKATGAVHDSVQLIRDETTHNVKQIKESTSAAKINSSEVVTGTECTITDKSINYKDMHTTTVTDNKTGVEKTFIFDNIGRQITVYTKDGDKITAAATDYFARKRSFKCESNCDSSDLNNLLLNGNFVNTTAIWDMPQSYTEFSDSELFAGTKDVSIKSGSITQTVSFASSNTSPTTYLLSAWAKADSLYIVNNRRITAYGDDIFGYYESDAADDYKRNRKFGMTAKVYNGTTLLNTFVMSFDNYNKGWQLGVLPIFIDDESKVTKIEISLSYVNNSGGVKFSNCSLRKCDEYSARTIESDGSVLVKTEKGETKYMYDGQRLVKSVFTALNGRESTAEYKYDGKGRLNFKKDHDGNCRKLSYDDKDNVVRSETYNIADATLKYVEEYAYDADGNIVSKSDPRGDILGKRLCDETSYRDGEVSEVRTAAQSLTAYAENGIVCDAFGDGNANVVSYNKGYLTRLSHNGFDYQYEYDGKGRVLKTDIAGVNIITNTYTDSNVVGGDSTCVTQLHSGSATPCSLKTTTDSRGNVKTVENVEASKTLVAYTYDDKGRVKEAADGVANLTYKYSYYKDMLCGTSYNDTQYWVGASMTYEDDLPVKYSVIINGNFRNTVSTYENEKGTNRKILKSQSLPNNMTLKPRMDALGRINEIRHLSGENTVMSEVRNYVRRGERTCDLVSSERFGINGELTEHTKYMYDKAGNITEVYENGRLVNRYFYDTANRVIREDNKAFGKTTTFIYDVGGNILVKNEYAFTLGGVKNKTPENVIPYTYSSDGWRDQMTSYNGEKCEYDAMGRPTKYRNANIHWHKFGTLSSYVKGERAAAYSYNAQGIRQKNTIIGTTFLLDGTKLLRSVDYRRDIWYNYGVNGIHGITVYNKSDKTTTEYVFRKNVFGDVTHIYKLNEGALELAAEYKYDAWGNHKVFNAEGAEDTDSTFIGNVNRIRYRGYYFDTESGLYYLNARYYDPETGRFISADETKFLDPNTVNGLNLYAYCVNNPVMNVDPSGTWSWKNFWGMFFTAAAAVVAAAAGIALTVLSFGIASPLLGLGCAVAGGALLGMANEVANSLKNQVQAVGWDNVDLKQTWIAGGMGTVTGSISGMMSFGFGAVVGEMGRKFGFALGKLTISGLAVSNVFNSAILMSVFRVAGGAFGGSLGSILGDHISADIFGSEYTNESLNNSFANIIQSWLLEFWTWLFKL